MHGLINRSIQCFVRDTYGAHSWAGVAEVAGVGNDGFEAMLRYEDALTIRLLDAAANLLDKPVDTLLEDLGTFLVCNPNTESVRRLLRFGGETFADFLQSLDDLRGRAQLAVPDLEFPRLELRIVDAGVFSLRVEDEVPGFIHVLKGVLRAIADDYGALVILEDSEKPTGTNTIQIRLLDSTFSEGRSFSLAQPEIQHRTLQV